jgi:hypothetical protein
MIQITHQFNDDRSKLILIADADAKEQLIELVADKGQDDAEIEALDHLTSNSELQWIDPADTGALTDAPILGILGDESHREHGPFGNVPCGKDADGALYQPILERWGFEPYQVRSFITDLIVDGKAVFINSW